MSTSHGGAWCTYDPHPTHWPPRLLKSGAERRRIHAEGRPLERGRDRVHSAVRELPLPQRRGRTQRQGEGLGEGEGEVLLSFNFRRRKEGFGNVQGAAGLKRTLQSAYGKRESAILLAFHPENGHVCMRNSQSAKVRSLVSCASTLLNMPPLPCSSLCADASRFHLH